MKLFAIFGNPVAHSRSPLLHNAVFLHGGIDARYIRIHLEEGDRLRERFSALALDGANITVPHKETAFALCDEVRGIAREIGAVNTIVREGERLVGYNTDAPGFMEAIAPFCPIRRAVILGAGGTARAVAAALAAAGIDVTVVNRGRAKLAWFADKGWRTYDWSTFESDRAYDLIVNTTSAGLADEASPLPEGMLASLLAGGRYAVDCIYGHETPFLADARRHGLTVKDGGDMLVFQAVLANRYFIRDALSSATILQLMKNAFIL